MENDVQHPYDALTPDMVMAAVESLGHLCDARLLALNSYENRVYQVGIEGEQPLIAKFYRPERWTNDQILEEHGFTQELFDADISVVAPMRMHGGQSLYEFGGFQFALFRRQGGHPPELDNLDSLLILGRTLGRMHTVGASSHFKYRHELSIQRMAQDSYQFLSEHFIPTELQTAYVTLCEDLIARIRDCYQPQGGIRVHGDCHSGNILWRADTAHFVDLDDCVTAPVIQDLWMLLSGDYQQRCRQLSEVLEGYNEFADFNPVELNWVEAMRTMRIIYYSAWLGRRWADPAFPRSFPWFNDARYWSDHILELREQLAAFDEPVLKIY